MAFQDRLAALETAMAEAGGMASFDFFVTWAQSEMADYLPPMVREEEDA
jgi:hypothetical protein